METTALTYQLSQAAGVRQRVEAVVRQSWWDDPGADPTASVPLDALAWAVGTNVTIRAGVADRLTNGADMTTAVAGITDNDLTYVVLQALGRLSADAPAT